jgi:phosphate transport system substrate-binding protein
MDGSGTSEIFTSYLNAVAPKIWHKSGNKDFKTAFPGTMSPYFQGVSGSTQVAMSQKMFKGSISYNEVSYTKNLKTAGIENEAGKFTYPTTSAAATFLSKLSFNENGSAILNYKNVSPISYNISTFAYAIAYKESGDRAKEIKDFFTFALTKCNKIDGYSPITGNALKVAKLQIAKIK